MGIKTKTSFVKGDSRCNRNGRPRIPDDVKKIRLLTKEDFTLIFSHVSEGSLKELQEIATNPNTKVKDIIICKALAKAIQTGDFHFIQPYLEYIIGKPHTPIDVYGDTLSNWIDKNGFDKKPNE